MCVHVLNYSHLFIVFNPYLCANLDKKAQNSRNSKLIEVALHVAIAMLCDSYVFIDAIGHSPAHECLHIL